MIVYGERVRSEAPRGLLAEIARRLDAAAAGATAVATRDALVAALLTAGELWQGLADAALARAGFDDVTPEEERGAALARAVAAALLARDPASLAAARDAAERLASSWLPARVQVNDAVEGFVHYAVDPLAYAAAAAAALDGDDDVVVIGLRSAGTALGASVAAALGARAVALASLRPVGHPFQRRLAIGARLGERLRAGARDARYAVVDEGPGLSGSSFAAVVRWLHDAGVDGDRVHLFPSHPAPPGPHATSEVRRLWYSTRRHPVASHVPREGAVELSGGRWREHLAWPSALRPPVDARRERRKLLVRGGTTLAKFAGHGRHGELVAARARRLAAAGLHPRVDGLTGGFLYMPWHAGARPLHPPPPGGEERDALLDAVARTLVVRAAEPPDASPGASPAALLGMARKNVVEWFGAGADEALAHHGPRVAAIAAAARPVATDDRMHAWEWLRLEDGTVWKTDVDHSRAHDLVGCQDLAWDVAGAIVELDLAPAELDRLFALLPPIAHLDFYVDTYLAFQLGLAADGAAGAPEPDDAALAALAEGYAARLAVKLGLGVPSPRRAGRREW